MIDRDALEIAIAILREGGVIAYPTEAVWGLGCDPDNPAALQTLIDLKQRDPSKGLILIAGDIDQLGPWLSELNASDRQRLRASWPGHVTWLVPHNGRSQPLLRGEHASVALRVSDHPMVAELCAAFGGPLVSTSANPAREPPALDSATVRDYFGPAVHVVEGALGGYARPSTIRDLRSGEIVRD